MRKGTGNGMTPFIQGVSPTDPDLDFLRSLPEFPIRSPFGHKGTYGTSVLIGGSRGMSGSISLAGRAALVAGSGLVRLLIPDRILETVAALTPEYTMIPLLNDDAGKISFQAREEIETELLTASAVGLGPGLGRSPELNVLVPELFFETAAPMVLDADALNALSATLFQQASGRQPNVQERRPKGIRVLTPHPGEFARMTGIKPPADTAGRQTAARQFILKYQTLFPDSGSCSVPPLFLVLKGHETIITDGRELFVNKTGNPGMGTAGSGDVLTGILTALLAQKLAPMTAVRLAVALHGLAGDCAASVLPMESITATDLIRFFPAALAYFRSLFR